MLGCTNSQVAFGKDLAPLGDAEFVAVTPFHIRLLQMVLGAMIIRLNYYFAWTLADGGNNLAGFGYQVCQNFFFEITALASVLKQMSCEGSASLWRDCDGVFRRPLQHA